MVFIRFHQMSGVCKEPVLSNFPLFHNFFPTASATGNSVHFCISSCDQDIVGHYYLPFLALLSERVLDLQPPIFAIETNMLFKEKAAIASNLHVYILYLTTCCHICSIIVQWNWEKSQHTECKDKSFQLHNHSLLLMSSLTQTT